MHFPAYLRELGQLIEEGAVISSVYLRLVMLDTIEELAGLPTVQCGVITTSAKESQP